MKTFSLFEKHEDNFVICLGQFDGLHLGHKKVLESAKVLADKLGVKVALFTIVKPRYEGTMILSFDELVFKAQTLGVDAVIYARAEEDNIYSLDKDEFLRLLTENFGVKGLVFGEDYTFGKGAAGNADYLVAYCEKVGIQYVRQPLYFFDGRKISSSEIRDDLITGNVHLANELLGDKYFIAGAVISGRHVGRKMGYPTINVRASDQKIPICDGVYKTEILIDGVIYRSLTSEGVALTFDCQLSTVETYVLDFDKEVYDEQVVIYFDRFIRKLRGFASAEKLAEQIKKDLEVYD